MKWLIVFWSINKSPGDNSYDLTKLKLLADEHFIFDSDSNQIISVDIRDDFMIVVNLFNFIWFDFGKHIYAGLMHSFCLMSKCFLQIYINNSL